MVCILYEGLDPRSMHTPSFFTPRIMLSFATLTFTHGDLNSVKMI